MAFNGTSDTRLLAGNTTLPVGASSTVRFTTRVAYASAAGIPTSASNIVYASSTTTVDPAINGNPGFTFPNNEPFPPPDVVPDEDLVQEEEAAPATGQGEGAPR